MSSPIHPEPQVPLSLDELRKKRAAAADFALPLASTLEVTDQGVRFCLFQKSNRFALDHDEQMIALTPQALFQAFAAVQGAWYGLIVRTSPMPVPGMPGTGPNGPNGPVGPPSNTGTPA